MSFLLLNVYHVLHYSDREHQRDATAIDTVERMFRSEQDARFYNPITGEVVLAARRQLATELELPLGEDYDTFVRAHLAAGS